MNYIFDLIKDINDNFGVILSALATVLLAVVAIFQDRLRSCVMKPKIKIKSINFTNDDSFPHITSDLNGNLLYFHLKKNKFKTLENKKLPN